MYSSYWYISFHKILSTQILIISLSSPVGSWLQIKLTEYALPSFKMF